jgi:hypothetical protein
MQWMFSQVAQIPFDLRMLLPQLHQVGGNRGCISVHTCCNRGVLLPSQHQKSASEGGAVCTFGQCQLGRSGELHILLESLQERALLFISMLLERGVPLQIQRLRLDALSCAQGDTLTLCESERVIQTRVERYVRGQTVLGIGLSQIE